MPTEENPHPENAMPSADLCHFKGSAEAQLSDLQKGMADLVEKTKQTQDTQDEVTKSLFGDRAHPENGMVNQVHDLAEVVGVLVKNVLGNGDKERSLMVRAFKLEWRQRLLWAIVMVGGGAVLLYAANALIRTVASL